MSQQQRKSRNETEAKLFRLLAENVKDYAIFVTDSQGRVQSWNQGAERLLGYSETEVIGQSSDIFCTPEDIQAGVPQQEMDQALAGGRGNDDRWQVRKDGSRFWSGCTMTPLWDENHKLLGFAKIMRDRTAWKRAEDARNDALTYAQSIVETVREPLIVLDGDLRVRTANRSFYKTFQVVESETEGRLLYDLGNRQWDIPQLRTALEEILPKNTSFVDFEVTHTFPSIGPKVICLNARRIYRKGNHTELILLAIEDITERRRLENERRELETRFTSLVKNIRDHSIFSLDPEGRITSWNREAERILGYSEAEAIGQHFSIIFSSEDRQAGVPGHELRTALSEGRAEDERWHVRKCGEPFWALGIVTPTFDASGKHTGYSKILRDMTDRKRVEEEARFNAALVEKVGQAVIATAPDGRIIYWNRFAETLYGWTKAEAIGRNVVEVAVPQSQAADANEIMKRLAAGESWSGEFLVRRRDGTTFPALVTNAPILDDQGVLTAIVGISSDITQWKQTTEALLQSEQRFRALMEQAPFSIQVFSPDGRTIRVNRAWEELWGVRFEQIEGYNVLEDRQLEARGVLQYIQQGFSGQAARIPAIQYNPNDTIPDITQEADPRRWLSAVIYPLKDGEGKIREVVLIHEDITARYRAEEDLLEAHRNLENRVAERTAELVRANEFLKALLENVQTGIVACDAAGVLTLFNSVTRALHGLPEESLPPIRWAEKYRLYQPDGETPMAVEDVPLYRAFQGERVVNAEMVIRPEGSPPRTVLAAGQAFYDHQGNKHGAVVSMHDITQRKQAEEALRKVHEELERRVEERTKELAGANNALREADRRKDEFLATLAHELRNPLAPIRNSLQILKMPRVDAMTAQQTREMMERQVHHLVRLVDDLLDVSRVMRGKIELRREPVELATVVARAVETVQPLIQVQGHELEISLPTESLLVDADPVRLTQIIGNLLTNAAKYTEGSGRIWLTAQRGGNDVVMKVRDTGIGIAPDMLPHVFELFVQVDYAATRSQGGLGIGLTLVKNLVEMHGGSVTAYSAGLGKGSEFVVRLPLLALERPQTDENKDGEEQPKPARALGHRLLVVDDNHDAAISLATLLQLQGHEVRVAHNGQSALEIVTTFRPDVVFLDIGMPGMDGYEVARRLRQQTGLEKVVLAALTGWGQQEDRRRSAEAGFNYHLVKPPEPKALESLLASLGREQE